MGRDAGGGDYFNAEPAARIKDAGRGGGRPEGKFILRTAPAFAGRAGSLGAHPGETRADSVRRGVGKHKRVRESLTRDVEPPRPLRHDGLRGRIRKEQTRSRSLSEGCWKSARGA